MWTPQGEPFGQVIGSPPGVNPAVVDMKPFIQSLGADEHWSLGVQFWPIITEENE